MKPSLHNRVRKLELVQEAAEQPSYSEILRACRLRRTADPEGWTHAHPVWPWTADESRAVIAQPIVWPEGSIARTLQERRRQRAMRRLAELA